MHTSRSDGSKSEPRCQQYDQNEHKKTKGNSESPFSQPLRFVRGPLCNYEPITAILYTSRMITVDTEIQIEVL